MCEDYRATFGVDLEMDTADFAAGRRVTCPSLILWGAKGGVGRNHKALEVWAPYATQIVRGATVPSGHYLQEECPEETYAELSGFFRETAGGRAGAGPSWARSAAGRE